MKIKSFNSFFADELEDYLNYRQSLGFKIKNLRYNLRNLDNYFQKTGATHASLTPLFFLEFKKNIESYPRTANNILSATRGFFNYMIRKELITENPLQDIPFYKENAYIPFIFSHEETNNMLQAVQKRIRHSEKYFFNDMMIYTVILLLAKCGLRMSEPLKLRLNKYREDEGTIYIERTKFYKDRLIPPPRNTLKELNNYIAVRKARFRNNENPFLFPGRGCKSILNNRIYPVFHQAVRDVGLNQSRRVIDNMCFGAPIPHSLRHSFAVNTLKKIKARGESPQQALPILSAYMGHRKCRYTAVYLKIIDAKHRQHLVDFSISKQKDL